MTDPRRIAVVDAAKAEVGNGPHDTPKYWADVGIGPPYPTPGTATGHWCGAFALWALHRAMLAIGQNWIVGRGFIAPLGLPVTKHPEPGDILYKNAPYQHHGIVESLENGLLTSIEGNTPDVARKSRPLPPDVTFFSIAKLLGAPPTPTKPQPPPTPPPITGSDPPGLAAGIDVSHHQAPGAINWAALAKTHRFVIARATYGAKIDETFRQHVELARGAGLITGAYHFFRPGVPVAEQLDAFARAVEPVGFGPGWLAPALDIEQNERYDGPISADRYAPAEQICSTWKRVHGAAMIYTNPSMWGEIGSPAWIGEHHLWVSHYGVSSPRTPLGLSWVIWQHRVATLLGIGGGPLDQNVARALPILTESKTPQLLPLEVDWDQLRKDRDGMVE
jgi:GH25 family lysozyme M1 (1,4-beta-N-acetylmuramidase)